MCEGKNTFLVKLWPVGTNSGFNVAIFVLFVDVIVIFVNFCGTPWLMMVNGSAILISFSFIDEGKNTTFVRLWFILYCESCYLDRLSNFEIGFECR